MHSHKNGEPHINPVVIHHVFEVLSLRQISPAELCMGMGISAKDFDTPDLRLTRRQTCLLLDKALRLLPEASLGHQVGSRRSVVSTGIFGMALATCATVADMLSLTTRHQHHFGAIPSLREEAAGQGQRCLIADPSHVPKHIQIFAVSEAFAAFVGLVRSVLGQPFHPWEVTMSYPGSVGDDALKHFYGVPVQLSQTENRLTLCARSLATALPTSDAVVHAQMIRLIEERHASPTQSALIQAIERLVRSRLDAPPKLATLATSLGTSERTLRRKLSDQGTSYQDIIDNIYREEAVRMLQHSDLSITQVAGALSFSDVRNFRRAFRRWTGHVPTHFRKHGA